MKDKTKIAKKLRNMNGFNGSYKSTWNFNKHDIAHSSLYKIVGFAVAKFHISYTHLHLINIESKFVVISFFSDYIVELHFENRFSMLSEINFYTYVPTNIIKLIVLKNLE